MDLELIISIVVAALAYDVALLPIWGGMRDLESAQGGWLLTDLGDNVRSVVKV